jgi:hypothetical protein
MTRFRSRHTHAPHRQELIHPAGTPALCLDSVTETWRRLSAPCSASALKPAPKLFLGRGHGSGAPPASTATPVVARLKGS